MQRQNIIMTFKSKIHSQLIARFLVCAYVAVTHICYFSLSQCIKFSTMYFESIEHKKYITFDAYNGFVWVNKIIQKYGQHPK